MRRYKSSLLSCRKCKIIWILKMMQDNFKRWNQITVGDCRTFPVILQWFQVLVPCWAATKACLLTHGIKLHYGEKRFWSNQFSTFDSLRDHHQGIQSCAPQEERGPVPQATGDSFRKRWQTLQRHNSNADICKKAVDCEFYDTGGVSA